jgi:hypothetical protein
MNTSFSVGREGKWFLDELCMYLLRSTQFNSPKNHLPSPTENSLYRCRIMNSFILKEGDITNVEKH